MKELEEKEKSSSNDYDDTTSLVSLVETLGGDMDKIYCRGSWNCLEFLESSIKFCTETAWEPCNQVWDLVQEKFPSLAYFYQAEEPGMCIYITNDDDGYYFPEKFKVDLCTPDERYETEYFTSEEMMFRWFKEMLEIEVNSLEDINALHEKWDKENEDAYCYVYEYEIV